MERKTIKTSIGKSVDIDLEYPSEPFGIKELKEFLIDAEEKGATNISISGSSWDGVLADIEIQPIKIELENDSDFEERVKEEEFRETNRKMVAKARERELYEELKIKYEKHIKT